MNEKTSIEKFEEYCDEINKLADSEDFNTETGNRFKELMLNANKAWNEKILEMEKMRKELISAEGKRMK